MITADHITAAGQFVKPHGIKGEMTAHLAIDSDYFQNHDCVICQVNGIFVPFFITSFRPKGTSSVLICLEGVTSEAQARGFVGKTFYVDRKSYIEYTEDFDTDDTDGAYADDFIGYSIIDSAEGSIGEITAVETSTDNALFIVESPDEGKVIYVPIVDEFIDSIDDEARVIHTSLPVGLVDLNS